MIGHPADMTYEYTHLGTAAKDISKAASSKFVTAMKGAKSPMIIVGPGVLARSDAKAVLRDIYDLTTQAGKHSLQHLVALPSPCILPVSHLHLRMRCLLSDLLCSVCIVLWKSTRIDGNTVA